MTTTWVPGARGGQAENGPEARSRVGAAKRRRMLRLVAGAGVMVGCAVGFWLTAIASGGHSAVLALARPVSFGQVLTAEDLRAVTLGDHGGVPVVAASRREEVVGRVITSVLPAGALLSDAVLAPSLPAAGQAVVTVSVKGGRVPSVLGPGSQVAVSESRTAGPTGGGAVAVDAPVRGTVLDVRPGPGGNGATVVTVVCEQGGALRVAQLQDPAVIVLPAQSAVQGR